MTANTLSALTTKPVSPALACHRRRSGLVFALLLACAACERDKETPSAQPPFTAVRDTIAATRAFALPVGDATQFTRITRVMIGPDNNVYVLDAEQQWITVFDASGVFARRIGHRGSGPGEFEGSILRAGFLGDTVWVEDWIKHRTQWFALDGKVIRQTADTLEIDHLKFPELQQPFTYLRDGAALYESNAPALTVSLSALGPIVKAPVNHSLDIQPRRDSSTAANTKFDTLVLRSAWRGLIPIPNAGTLRVAGIPTDTILTFDAFGNGATLVTQSSTDVGRQMATVSIQQWDARGTRSQQRILGEGHTSPVPTSARDSIYAKAIASLNRLLTQLPEIKKAVSDPDQLIRSMLQVREFYPVVQDARTVSDGSIWLRVEDASTVQRWIVLDAQLKPLRLVQLPLAVHLEDVAHDHVWVTERDALDVMTVAVYLVPAKK